MDITSVTILTAALAALATVIGAVTGLLKELRSWKEPRDRDATDRNSK